MSVSGVKDLRRSPRLLAPSLWAGPGDDVKQIRQGMSPKMLPLLRTPRPQKHASENDRNPTSCLLLDPARHMPFSTQHIDTAPPFTRGEQQYLPGKAVADHAPQRLDGSSGAFEHAVSVSTQHRNRDSSGSDGAVPSKQRVSTALCTGKGCKEEHLATTVRDAGGWCTGQAKLITRITESTRRAQSASRKRRRGRHALQQEVSSFTKKVACGWSPSASSDCILSNSETTTRGKFETRSKVRIGLSGGEFASTQARITCICVPLRKRR
mmetsp:Transcript_44769/g.104579  ORF Transcript_44769/g.104579 Transcript_44769/m.104579 type:complete len:267 (+) Transcript_44769:292-1092(+)